MSQRYLIRMFRSCENDDEIGPGTIVEPVNDLLSKYAHSGHDAEESLKTDIQKGKLPAGRVYQICPSLGNIELIRSLTASKDGSFERVFLDPASGMYGEQRRIRLASTEPRLEKAISIATDSLR